MKEDIDRAVPVLQKEGIIVYPTDTVWGIGCDATSENDVKKIFSLKQRDDSKSMLLLVDHVNMIYDYIKEMPDIALQILEASDTPITIVYPGAERIARNLIAKDGSIAIRIVNDSFCCQLIRKLKRPLVSTSANISGKKTAGNFSEIETAILEGVDYVVKHRQNEICQGQPSPIVKVGLKGEIEIIRK
jgi:L-threonylcarbamoyladenylate synthase